MKTVLTLCLLLYSVWVSAYSCSNFDPIDEAYFRKYKYIAFVKVKTFAPFTIPTLTDKTRDYVRTACFTVEVLENFKAQLPDTLLMEGYKTSCDIGLRPGEEWIILANDFNNYATVFPCSNSERYRDKAGKRDLVNNSGELYLQKLRQLFNHLEPSKEGQYESTYPNGKKEYTEFYKKGKLEGARLYWYPNGQLWGKETYVNGLKDGVAERWFEDGYLEERTKYKVGVPIDSSQIWYQRDTSQASLLMLSRFSGVSLDSIKQLYSRHQLSIVKVNDQKGNSVYSKCYYRSGRIMTESFVLSDKNVRYWIRYREDGSVETTILSENVDNQRYGKLQQTLVEIDYKTDGTRNGFYNDRKGRLLRRTLVKDGVETILEEKQYNENK